MGDLGGNSYAAGPVVESERSWAMAAHLGVMAGSVVPFGNILAPLAIWIFKKNESPFVAKHALESLMFQIGVLAAASALAILVFATMGAALLLVLPAVVLLIVGSFVYMIVGTVRANEGKIWEYPITTRFVP